MEELVKVKNPIDGSEMLVTPEFMKEEGLELFDCKDGNCKIPENPVVIKNPVEVQTEKFIDPEFDEEDDDDEEEL